VGLLVHDSQGDDPFHRSARVPRHGFRSWSSPAVLLLLAACSSPTGQARDDLEENRDRWQALDLHSYSVEFRRVCFCGGPLQPVRVVVRGDSVVSVTDPTTGQPPQFLPSGWAGTIDQIFVELIRDSHTAASMELGFDPTYHFPSHAKVDRIKNAIDDEYELTLADLRPER
jgi:hypothetical protein